MLRSLVIAGLVAAAAFGAAHAEDEGVTSVPPPTPPVKAVLELFTSQGCSSCPPADVVLKGLAERRDIVALSLPVDYWDYLGWKDTFASPKNAERQRTYAKTRGDGAIYTPQVVLNGQTHLNGAKRRDIEAAIESAAANFEKNRIPVRFWHQRNSLFIETGLSPNPDETAEAVIWLAIIQKTADVDIGRGENGGKKLTYTNIVRELTPIGVYKGKPVVIQLARAAIMRPETEAAAVLIQNGRGGPIVGAAWAGLW